MTDKYESTLSSYCALEYTLGLFFADTRSQTLENSGFRWRGENDTRLFDNAGSGRRDLGHYRYRL